MALSDWLALLHPTIAVVVVFPLLGIVLYQAWLTRSRRLSLKAGEKSAVPPSSGPEHVRMGRILSMAVVIVAVLGLAYPLFTKMLINGTLQQRPLRLVGLALVVPATLASLFFLDRSTTRPWRAASAMLTGMGLSILGLQPEIYHRDSEWYLSHYYLGMLAAMLMIFSLTIVQNIYRDRTNRWRKVHIILNSFATLLFLGQGFTGSRDLLEIPIGWQTPYIDSLYKQMCKTQPCTIAPAPALPKQP
jgi:cytosine/uracil/thiamine/allantoin permease